MANEVSVEITVEERAALRALAKLSRGIDQTTKDATKSVKKMDIAFGAFAGTIAADFAGRAMSAAISATKEFVIGASDAARETEKLKTQFQVLTGDIKVAADLFEELTEFSATTPFQLNNIAEASAQLLSFGFEADTVRDRIQKIGDVAAGSNSDLKEVALIYGQVAAAGKLTGERLLQLQERAIPIGPAIARTMGVAESEVRKLISAGKVTQEVFEEAFNSMSAEGGMFEGAIAKQSKTVNGALSTMSDNFKIMQAALGEAFAPAIVDTAGELSGIMQELAQSFRDNGPAIAQTAKVLAELFVIEPSKFIADLLTEDTPAEKVENLTGKLKDLKEEASQLVGLAGQDITAATELEAINAQIVAIEQKLELERMIRDERRKMSGGVGLDTAIEAPEEEEKAKEVVADPTQDARVLKERAVQEEIKAIRAEAQLSEQERQLMLKEAQGIATEEDLERLREIELQKIALKGDAEMEKANLIKDSKERELQREKIFAKTQMDLEKKKTEQEINEIKRRNMLREQQQQVAIQASRNFLSAGITLAKQGSAEQKALMSADAVISTYAAATQALKAPPGPPWSFALAASTIAMGLANVAKINSQSFATGGVVGGFTGASMGPDNTIAQVRTGEMVLTGNDQRELFEDIRRGGGNENIMMLKEAILSQPIIVQIDNKEVARAVRDAQRDGFRITA